MAFTEGKTDADLQIDVLDGLNSEPIAKVKEIAVLVKDGVVTLNGRAENHGEKLNAVRTVMQVAGVMAVSDDIKVDLPELEAWNDSDLAIAAANRIAWCTMMPLGAVDVSVLEGRITLAGVLERSCQKQAAENALQNLAGVTGITNLITIHPAMPATETGTDLEAADQSKAKSDEIEIQVETSGSSVLPDGRDPHQAEPEEAPPEATVPGDQPVETQLKMDWFWGIAN
jgi:osmotically-inducible protein OsmY